MCVDPVAIEAAARRNVRAMAGEQIAQEIEAQREKCVEHWPMPKGDCWLCQRWGAFTRAARIARGEHAPPPVARWRSYLPMECALCGRRRLEYRTIADGDVVEVKCEKCGASSEWDAFTVER